jgi:hypothetical protein
MADQSRTDRRPLPRATSGPQPWQPPEQRHTPGGVWAPDPLAVPAVAGWVDPDDRVVWFEHRGPTGGPTWGTAR